MTDKVLSQDEIDALLKGVAAGDIDTEEAKGKMHSKVRHYDFRKQERIILGKMPGLEMINDAFSRSFRNAVSAFVMKYTEIKIQNINTPIYGDFMNGISMPSSINIFTMSPLKGYALLVLEAPLVFALLEFFFGGSIAQDVKTDGRAFTLIEERVIKKVVDIALNEIKKTWSIITSIEPEYIGSEINPQFVSIVTPSETVITVEIDIEIENFTGKMFICIPFSMVEPIKEKLYSGMHGSSFQMDNKWAEVMREALKGAEVNVSAEIGRLIISLKDIMDFEIGSVINIGASVTDELPVKVEGALKFKGRPGIFKGNQAIKLTGVVDQG
jgi:flagellar motor switch protein FliM